MDNQTQEVPQATNNYQWLRTLSIGFGIVSFGIAIGVIGYILGTKNSQTVVQNQQSANIPTLSSPSPTPVDETAYWKIYQGDGFTFKHPNAWITEKYSIAGFPEYHGVAYLKIKNKEYAPATPGEMSISYWDNPNELSLQQFEKEHPTQAGTPLVYFPNAVAVSIGDHKAYLTKDFCHPIICDQYIVPIGKNIYNIKVYRGSDSTTVDQVLSTFQFSP